MSSTRRPTQDWNAFPNYLTAEVWTNMQACPFLALDMLCIHLNALGLINPTEPTSALIAAAACSLSPHLQQPAIQAMFHLAKKRIKNLYRTEPVDYIWLLPANPVDMLHQWPTTCLRVFSESKPPIANPFNMGLVNINFDKIEQRGGRKKPCSTSEFFDLFQAGFSQVQASSLPQQPHVQQQPRVQQQDGMAMLLRMTSTPNKAAQPPQQSPASTVKTSAIVKEPDEAAAIVEGPEKPKALSYVDLVSDSLVSTQSEEKETPSETPIGTPSKTPSKKMEDLIKTNMNVLINDRKVC